MDERNFYEEAIQIISGASMLLPQAEHLKALHESMQEHHEVVLIQVANDLEALKIRTLERS
jgi:hypothetical protein